MVSPAVKGNKAFIFGSCAHGYDIGLGEFKFDQLRKKLVLIPLTCLRKHVSIENKRYKHELKGRAKSAHPLEWPKNSQPGDYYINEEGMNELIFTSQQHRAKAFRKYCCNELFPQVRKLLVDKMLEEKDTQLAILNDDLTESQKLVIGLHGEIRAKDQEIARRETECVRLRERSVDHCQDPGKDNVVMIIRKHTGEEDDRCEYPYYIARIQRRAISKKRRWLLEKFPRSEEIVVIDNPNSVHAFNRLEEEGHVERYGCHFRLVDLTFSRKGT